MTDETRARHQNTHHKHQDERDHRCRHVHGVDPRVFCCLGLQIVVVAEHREAPARSSQHARGGKEKHPTQTVRDGHASGQEVEYDGCVHGAILHLKLAQGPVQRHQVEQKMDEVCVHERVRRQPAQLEVVEGPRRQRPLVENGWIGNRIEVHEHQKHTQPSRERGGTLSGGKELPALVGYLLEQLME